MKLSVVIPCHNSAATLGSLLESLAAQSWSEPWEVVIVDNRSSDDSVAVAERFRPRLPNLKIVAAHERGGAAYARNVGARVASGEALAFCDADDEVGTGWLAAMGKALTKWDCVAARLDFKKLNPPIVAKHNAWHEQCSGLQKAWYFPYLEHFGGGTFGIKRAIHEKIGGFDERYIALEDTEYCFRLQQAGYRIQFMPDVVMHIRARQDLIERLFQTVKYATYNLFLAEEYSQGTPTPSRSWSRYFKDWGLLAMALPTIRSKLNLEKFVWMVGWQIGMLKGSVKYRCVPLVLPCRPHGFRSGFRPQRVSEWSMRRRLFRKPSKRVAVVVPGYARSEFTSDEEISLRHMEHYLGPYDKYLVVPEGLNITRPGFRVEGFDPQFFGSPTASTRLMLSPEFYRRFEDYEYIFLCHLDALVLSDRLEEWCGLDLDYIAAPWIKCNDSPYVERERVGNGGFSLRKVESFLRVINSNRYWVEPNVYWKSVCARKSGLSRYLSLPKRYLKYFSRFNGARQEMASWHLRTDGRQNEDFFWADEAVRYYPSFKVASVEIGLRFAFEVAPRQCLERNHGNLPFGCHAWPRYDRAFWEPYLLK